MNENDVKRKVNPMLNMVRSSGEDFLEETKLRYDMVFGISGASDRFIWGVCKVKWGYA